MKKAFRIFGTTLLWLLAFLLALWLLLQTPIFQQWLVNNAASRFSKMLGTKVTVKKARIGFFNRVKLEGIFLEDLQNDTLVSVGLMQVNTSDWFFQRDSIDLKYLRVADVTVRFYRKDTIWNYQFIADKFVSKDSGGASVFGIRLQEADVEAFRFMQVDAWKGKTLVGGVGKMHLLANEISIDRGIFDIRSIDMEAPEFREFRLQGLWPDQIRDRYYQNIDSLARLPKRPKEKNSMDPVVRIAEIRMKTGIVEIFNRKQEVSTPGVFDERDILVNPLSGVIRNLVVKGDTIRASANLTAYERSGLHIKKLSTDLTIHPNMMEFANLDFHLNESRLGPYYSMQYSDIDQMENFVDSVKIVARISNSQLSMQDLAFFAPDLRSIHQVATLNGYAHGTVSDFTIENLDLATGKSRLQGTYRMKGLVDIEKTLIHFETPASRIALEDVAVWAPEVLNLRNTPVDKFGVITYRGLFSGTVFDFMAKGRLNTNVGSMNASVKMKLNAPRAGFTANITDADLDGAALLGVPKLGRLQFSGSVSSNGLGARYPLALKGLVSDGVYNNYHYRDIRVEGSFLNSKLDVDLSSNDSNLTANINAVLNFKEKNQRYNARGAIAYANLEALHFSKDTITVSGLFDVDFKGANIDEFLGYARFYDAQIMRNSTEVSIDSFYLSSTIDSLGLKSLVMRTNEADLDVKGIFNLSDLPNGFQLFLSRYYPSVIKPPKRLVKSQQFTFSLVTREAEPLLAFIDPEIKGLNYATLIGSIDLDGSELFANAEIPYFQYGTLGLSNSVIKAQGSVRDLSISATMDNIGVNDSLSFPKAVIRIDTHADTTSLSINTSTQGPLGDAALSGVFYSKEDGFDLHFNESSFILNNKRWTVDKDGIVQMRNGYLVLNDVFFKNNEQELALYTLPSEEHNWNNLYARLKKINMGDFLPFFLSEPRLEGMVSGMVTVINPMGKPIINYDLKAEAFYFNNDSVGMVNLDGSYNTVTQKLQSNIDSRNPEYDFSSLVKLDFSDSAEKQIETTIHLRNERISLLQEYLKGIMKSMDGLASGDLKLVGSFGAPKILGDVTLRKAELTIDYTKVTYFIDSALLRFGDNYIDFGSIGIKDTKGRKGTMEGIMYHRFFDSLVFNMRMRTDGMEVLNTKSADNDLFYGYVVGRANFDLAGPLTNLKMRISGAPVDSSQVYISNKTGKESGEADFIVFKQYGREMEEYVAADATNLHIDLDLTANPLVRIDVILDDITNDVIQATGSGNFKIKTGTFDETVMRGRYQLENGNYNYNFQSVFKKPFKLEGGDDSWIEWQGDPLEANMNIRALYIAENISLRDLMASEQGRTVLDQDAQSYKGNVYVRAKLSGKLSNPKITFEIDFPPGSNMRNNLSANDMLRRIKDDESEMLRQVTYLIVFGSFAPYKQGAGNINPGADLAMNTLSDILSKEMGKILTQLVQSITGDRSLNVDISTDFYNSQALSNGNVSASTGYDRVNFNFMLNKSYFNNRVVVNVGSDFDLNVRNTGSSGFQFLPDVSVEFVLTPNRRLRAILFKRDNLDFAGRRNRAGASISYRKEFDHFFGKNPEESFIIFRREDDKKKTAPPASKSGE